MSNKKELFDRLPEIYRIKDAEQVPPHQLKTYVELIEKTVFEPIRENIENLYHDLFIETCDDWVIPYIGDLLGTTHLQGDAWTRRADVADTIALRRRKGTIGAIELLTFDLTKWGVHVSELRNNLTWAQQLNHQRPDAGGQAPYGDKRPMVDYPKTPFGGFLPLKDPGLVALANTPFDPFAHFPDLKETTFGQWRYNLPNLAIFLWRLEAYTIPISQPKWFESYNYKYKASPASPELDMIGTRFAVHPLGLVTPLFNTHQFDSDQKPPVVTEVDEVPGPMHPARLSTASPAGEPESYVSVDPYDHTNWNNDQVDISKVGLQFHIPVSEFPASTQWTFRGADLSKWECSLTSHLAPHEIAIDPKLGRIIVPAQNVAQKNALKNHLLLTYTYGAVGPVGAHPIDRPPAVNEVVVNYHDDKDGLQKALENIHNANEPIVIEIQDSMVHDLNLTALGGTIDQDGGVNLQLKHSLTIRAAKDERPIIRLAHALRFRPTFIASLKVNEPERLIEQGIFDGLMDHLNVRLEGLFITPGASMNANQPLIARAAVNHLEIVNCTVDPGGEVLVDGSRAASKIAMILKQDKGLTGNEKTHFKQVPEIIVSRSIVGSMRIDTDYSIQLVDSILDAGRTIDEPLLNNVSDYALTAATTPLTQWAAKTQINNVTVLGRMRVESISGRGGLWTQTLEAWNNQKGCLKFCFFSGLSDRLPQHHACVFGDDAKLKFTWDAFNEPGYAQIMQRSDFRVREQGPGEDAMGAFNFLLEAYKWRNIKIRYREFMPVGIRPILIPIT